MLEIRCSLPLTRMPLRSFCSRQRWVRSRYSCIAGSSSSAGSHQASRLCSPAGSSLRPVARHSARRSSSMRSMWPMHCWRAAAGLVEAFHVAGLEQGMFLHQQAFERGELRVLLGHQGGELFAAMHGVVGWHGFYPALFLSDVIGRRGPGSHFRPDLHHAPTLKSVPSGPLSSLSSLEQMQWPTPRIPRNLPHTAVRLCIRAWRPRIRIV